MFILKKKIEKKEQMSIHDNEKTENASIENSLMKKEFGEEQQKNKNKQPTLPAPHVQHFKERMGEYYEEKPFKIHAKR